MKIKAKELKPGQTIHIEYGFPGNWIDFVVDSMEETGLYLCVRCHCRDVQGSPMFQKEEFVEVLA